MKSLGVSDTNQVLIYDYDNLSRAGRLWWVLKYIGKKDVFVLEGGIDKWMDKFSTRIKVYSLLTSSIIWIILELV